MYVYMYVCVYVCIYVRMYICMYVCVYISKYVYMCVCMYVCVCVYVCMHKCMYVPHTVGTLLPNYTSPKYISQLEGGDFRFVCLRLHSVGESRSTPHSVCSPAPRLPFRVLTSTTPSIPCAHHSPAPRLPFRVLTTHQYHAFHSVQFNAE